MVEKLMKYMRNMGLDAEFVSAESKDNKLELAKKEKRVLITKEVRALDNREGIPTFLPKSNKPEE
jgi:uncharacterized protein with PIN domain